jgi:Holliday junction resolvase
MGNLTPEAKIKRKVTTLLKDLGVWYFFPANNGFGKSGIPDIIAIANGVFVGIECKADPSKKPTVLQQKCGEEIRAAGGMWFLVRCDEDIEVLSMSLKMLKC